MNIYSSWANAILQADSCTTVPVSLGDKHHFVQLVHAAARAVELDHQRQVARRRARAAACQRLVVEAGCLIVAVNAARCIKGAGVLGRNCNGLDGVVPASILWKWMSSDHQQAEKVRAQPAVHD